MLKKIDTQIYKLTLFAKYEHIHFVFHVLFLKSWYLRNENLKSQWILINDDKKLKFDAILNKKIRKNEFKYFIIWIDSSFYENSWKSMKYFENVKQIIKNFEFVQDSHKLNFENKRKKRKSQTKKKRNKFSKKK